MADSGFVSKPGGLRPCYRCTEGRKVQASYGFFWLCHFQHNPRFERTHSQQSVILTAKEARFAEADTLTDVFLISPGRLT